ncbi:hypothetical protein A5784_23780 [Mycobacterium sp. 852013-50091_SCH5140682]|uniref:hypothetical protein n=1 Tax=Mycobacterium sp. 852013-50091_SCH5140682 TaxID=1834109 RepID=UPI0007EBD9EB|nr:hypothetical protein [Mycobacterium sp. 852013-50091_SCH5140682]OBC17424.1 hypothetical protein A5784_23780 [Mycobacterium sp. 852013-50091_SCH5140682]
MVHNSRCRKSARRLLPRYGLSVVAVGIGIAGASGHAVAWADPGTSDSSGTTSSHSSATTDHGPKKPAQGHTNRPGRLSTTTKTKDDTQDKGPTGGAAASGTDTKAPKPDPNDSNTDKPQQDSTGTLQTPTALRQDPATDAAAGKSHAKQAAPTRVRAAVQQLTTAATSLAGGTATPRAVEPKQPAAIATPQPNPTTKAIPLTAKLAAATSSVEAPSTPTPSTPTPPQPLSPIAKLAELPGRVINSVLQALDITVSANGPKSPINFQPVDEALFAAFRRVEATLGLDKTPAAQPTPPPLTYTGPTTGKTPTVSQFLNAAAAEYVLGGTPGDLKPFTVDGKQMQSTNTLSGESAKAWVTPQGQIIVAYQGTTGGTNLLANPVIAISQIATDAQVIFTNTTPQAFTDSLAFEQQVAAEAAKQGYSQGDIFVTGHSLGGWEAEYVAQQTGVGGIGFESPGINTTVPGNGANSGFVNVETYGDTAAYFATDLPALQPFVPPYVPGGGTKPHYGSIVMIGDPTATTPLVNAASLWGTNPIGDVVFVVDILGNFFEHHLPGMQAYNLGVTPDPGVVPWLGATMGPVESGYGDMTIPELQKAASDAGTLITP